MGDDLEALPDIDLETYTRLAGKFRDLKTAIEDQIQLRGAAVVEAATDWQGQAAQQFPPRVRQGELDARELMAGLDLASTLLDGPTNSLRVLAAEENARRQAAREWLRKRAEHESGEGLFDQVGDFFTGEDWEDEIGPMPGAPGPEPALSMPPGRTPGDRRG